MEAIWRGVEVESLERTSITASASGVTVSSVIDSARGRYSYELECDASWRFRSLHLEALAGQRVLEISFDEEGGGGRGIEGWLVDGQARPDLAGCLDLDLAITPLTNTLPIRRLGLEIDEEADLEVVLVSFPDLEIVVDPQRYSRLDAMLWRFESLDDGFETELTVDRLGLVTDYPGLFERL